MNQMELAKALARALLENEKRGKAKSFSSLNSLRSYFSAMSMEDLLGIATQNGITNF